jgi:hypothetical protein
VTIGSAAAAVRLPKYQPMGRAMRALVRVAQMQWLTVLWGKRFSSQQLRGKQV